MEGLGDVLLEYHYDDTVDFIVMRSRLPLKLLKANCTIAVLMPESGLKVLGLRLKPQVICWDGGRPARIAPQTRRLSKILRQSFSRFALIAGGTPAVPANHLSGFRVTYTKARSLLSGNTIMEYSHLCLPAGVPIKPVPG